MTSETRLQKAPLYISAPTPCNYLEDRSSTMIFMDPEAEVSMPLYSRLVQNGFRRSGGFVYAPRCGQCGQCVPVRIPVAEFRPNRNQRRVHRRLDQLEIRERAAGFSEEHFRLYEDYLAGRHAGGGMDNPTPEQYISFLTADWADSRFVEFRHQGLLVAVAVVDYLLDGLSAVYTFFDPRYGSWSPGKMAILWQIQEALRLQKDFLYLGYWIRDCEKMSYKTEYLPIQTFRNNHWQQHDTFPPVK